MRRKEQWEGRGDKTERGSHSLGKKSSTAAAAASRLLEGPLHLGPVGVEAGLHGRHLLLQLALQLLGLRVMRQRHTG